MKYIDIKDKTEAELVEMLKEKKLELFGLNAKLKTMQLQNTAELRVAKKDIARIQTALGAARAKKD
jgi:large subunit ribosomal protein L29